MENKRKHLEFIQGVVNRMAANSFLLKGWSVTLVAALFALGAASARPVFVLLACVAVAMFWGLDGYFLWQERLFQKLYDHVRKQTEDEIDFSMNTAPFRKDGPTWLGASLSRTLLSFYGLLLGAITFVGTAL